MRHAASAPIFLVEAGVSSDDQGNGLERRVDAKRRIDLGG
jgi:hypothetical protein